MGCSGSAATASLINTEGEIAVKLYDVTFSPGGDEITHTSVYFFPLGIRENSRVQFWKKVAYPDPNNSLEDYIVDYTVAAGIVSRVEKNTPYFAWRFATGMSTKWAGSGGEDWADGPEHLTMGPTRTDSHWAVKDVASIIEDKVDLSLCKRCCCCLNPLTCEHPPHYKNPVGEAVWKLLPREVYLATISKCIRVGDQFEITLNSLSGESVELKIHSESRIREVASAFHKERGLRTEVDVHVLSDSGKTLAPDDLLTDID